MVYPFRIRINDPVLIKCFQEVSFNRSIDTRKFGPNLTKQIGHRIPRTIKRDGVFVKDGIFTITNPKIRLDFQPAYGKRKGYDFIFKTIF